VISRAAVQARSTEWGLTEEVVEKDYVLGWLLWGIGSHRVFGDQWIFKGGSCLKKCFVETYRFSEDLDFTVLDGGPLAPDDVSPLLVDLLDVIEQETGITLSSRAPVIRLRPGDQSAEGRIYYRGPRGAPGEARVNSTSRTTRPSWRHPSAARSPTPTTRPFRATAQSPATPLSKCSPRSSGRSGNARAPETSTTW
jgi:Nucleotidyl transferase AbiEii toxin, Type IV TA system